MNEIGPPLGHISLVFLTAFTDRDNELTLIGVYASQEPRETFKLANLHLPVSLPSQLLHSASAQIGVTIANMLPTFTIGINAGYTNTALDALLALQNLFWTVAGNATQTIFDGGTLARQLQAAKDTYEAAAWTYRGPVITAVQNVADALRASENDADALKAARDFERAAKISLDLAEQQMRTGYANVLT